tara:strand:- start:353 stop:937 length:585 start_codon:yes stop_codon:yes gene_type:complete
MNFSSSYLKQLIEEISKISSIKLEKIVQKLVNLRKRQGRLFIIGIGGSAANASHAVNDFRKLCNIDAITPIDNYSEFSATTNDQGFEFGFTESLKISKINKNDLMLVLSVGGGDIKKKSSIGIINSIKLAKIKKCKVISFTGKQDGYAGKNSDINVSLSLKKKEFLTPSAESIQPIIWHCLVSHPNLQTKKTFW